MVGYDEGLGRRKAQGVPVPVNRPCIARIGGYTTICQVLKYLIRYQVVSMFFVLYVDDEAALVDVTKIFLERSGTMSVDVAVSASDAIPMLDRRHYDAIIADYQMPDMDGIAFLKYVRSRHGDLPFILFTGKGREEVVIEALNNGASFYLQKGGEPRSQFAELEHKVRLAIEGRRNADELHESRQRMADIINFLPDATFAIDLAGTVIAWNKAMEEITGIQKKDILGTGDYSYAIPIYGVKRPLLINLVLNEDREVERCYPYITRQDNKLISELFAPCIYGGKGAYIWFIASRLYDTKGRVIGAIESIRDITDRKKMETALEESEQRYRNVIEVQTEFISRFLPDGTHVFVNEAYCRYFNKRREEIIGRKFIPEIPKEDRKVVRDHFASLTRDNPVAAVIHQIVMPDGRVRWQRWFDRAIFDGNGTLVEYQSVGRDITEQKQGEEAIRLASKKLTLLSGVTRHDILNKISALLLYQELMMNMISDPAIMRFVRKQIDTARLIQDQIAITKDYENIGVKSPQWQEVRQVVRKAMSGLDMGDVPVDCDTGGLEIYADPLLERVFYNLFDNSLRHGKNTTQITVQFYEMPDGLTLRVRDDGRGVPGDEKEKIFGKGYGENTGLGLFLVREILSITGISVAETGAPGTGGQFDLFVPKDKYRLPRIAN
jgi:PAS domain S-box-containing protein